MLWSIGEMGKNYTSIPFLFFTGYIFTWFIFPKVHYCSHASRTVYFYVSGKCSHCAYSKTGGLTLTFPVGCKILAQRGRGERIEEGEMPVTVSEEHCTGANTWWCERKRQNGPGTSGPGHSPGPKGEPWHLPGTGSWSCRAWVSRGRKRFSSLSLDV